MIREAFRRLYAGDDALQNHLILFVLTGFIMMLSKVLNMYSTPPLVDEAPFWLLLILALLVPVIGLYMAGYLYRVNHKAHSDVTPELLPDFSLENFKVFFKFLPVLLVWVLYGALLIFTFNFLSFLIFSRWVYILWNILYNICGAVYFLVVPFILARFCENYDRKGLYNPLKPLKDLYNSGKEVALLVVKLIPAAIVLILFVVLSANFDIIGFLFTALLAYSFTLVQYVVNYCYVQIYKEKISK